MAHNLTVDTKVITPAISAPFITLSDTAAGPTIVFQNGVQGYQPRSWSTGSVNLPVTLGYIRLSYGTITNYILDTPTWNGVQRLTIANVSTVEHTVNARPIPVGRFVDFIYDASVSTWLMEF